MSEEAHLPQGTIRYRDLGEGDPIVFVHGFLVDGRLWSDTAERLSRSHRCIVPDWPMGSHKVAMKPNADLSPYGVASLIDAFLAHLDLRDVTIVGNDSGGAMTQVMVTRHPERIARMVLTNCDTHENFPPGPFKAMPPLANVPGFMTALGLPFRIGAVRRASFAPFAKHRIPPDLIDSWMEPQSDPQIRRDTARLAAGMNKRYTLEAAEKLTAFEKPALMAWGADDRIFKVSHAERLAKPMPDARIERIPDARTFVSLDQPQRLAEAIEAFVAEKNVATAA